MLEKQYILEIVQDFLKRADSLRQLVAKAT